MVGSGLDSRRNYCSSSLQPFLPISRYRTVIRSWHLVPLLWLPLWPVTRPCPLTVDVFILDNEMVGVWGGDVLVIPRRSRSWDEHHVEQWGLQAFSHFQHQETGSRQRTGGSFSRECRRHSKGCQGGTFGNLTWARGIDTRLLWNDFSRANQCVSPVNILVPCSSIQMNTRCGQMLQNSFHRGKKARKTNYAKLKHEVGGNRREQGAGDS